MGYDDVETKTLKGDYSKISLEIDILNIFISNVGINRSNSEIDNTKLGSNSNESGSEYHIERTG